MFDRSARILLALLALLGAWHEGVHLLEHGHAHAAVESSCPHSHSHASDHGHGAAEHEPHAPFADPTFAHGAHIGHEHNCPLCLVPEAGFGTPNGVESRVEFVLATTQRPEPRELSRWELSVLPKRRGPPSV